MRGVDVDLPGAGVRLRATRWPGEGPAVLLLHGLASTRRFWDLVVPGLAGLPVVALDQRGHGDSERPSGPYDGDTVVQDALTALDALGLSRVIVVGHSWGAWTALRLAADAPHRVLAAVAVDGGLGLRSGPDTDRAALRVRLTPPRTALPADRLREILRSGPLGPWWSDDVERAVLAIFERGPDGLERPRLPFEAHMAIVDDLLDSDADAVWDSVTCPTWLIGCLPGGGGDGAEQARRDKRVALEEVRVRLAQPRVQEWHGALHDVPLQWPALVAGLVRAAWEEVAPPAGADAVRVAPSGEGAPS